MAESEICLHCSEHSSSKKKELNELIPPMTEWIQDEKMPPSYSISLSDSLCSDSTIDFEFLEKSEAYHSTSVNRPKLLTMENHSTQKPTFSCLKVYKKSVKESENNLSNSLTNTSMKSTSMHDVSNMAPGAKLVTALSCETIHSQSLSSTTKSKDSGFQRSVSCLSLSSGRRNYDHVESKVKAYIKNIKESEALRKKNKMLPKTKTDGDSTSILNDTNTPLGKEDLVIEIQELKHELHEKALFIDTQQRNYNSLLLKLAEAKNTIDTLRFQRISLNYSSLNESQKTKCQDIDFGVFEQEINKTLKQNQFYKVMSKSDGEEKVSFEKQSQNMFLGNTKRSSSIDFRPKNTSTPQKKEENKCLKPVSKIFSSGSRLDKDIKPLAKLSFQDGHSFSTSSAHVHRNSYQKHLPDQKLKSSVVNSLGSKTKDTVKKASLKEWTFCENKTNSLNIDLPNVDPFDKVKKWQASLPSIDLLDSSSDSGEDTKEAGADIQPPSTKEKEINATLSLELMSKLKISEKKRNYLFDKSCKSNKSKEPISSNNKYLTSNKSVGLAKEEPQVGSTSESETQTYLPKSSSWGCMSRRVIENSSSDSDESSSVSSSVLDSKASSLGLSSPKKSKNKLCSNKVVTSFFDTAAKRKFVLREPKLNYEDPNKFSRFKNENIFLKRNIPKNVNINNSVNLKVESSQRKAWNERNNTNFDVCKEFYFRRSSSLQDCLNIMQDMVDQGSSIIESTLERSKCQP